MNYETNPTTNTIKPKEKPLLYRLDSDKLIHGLLLISIFNKLVFIKNELTY